MLANGRGGEKGGGEGGERRREGGRKRVQAHGGGRERERWKEGREGKEAQHWLQQDPSRVGTRFPLPTLDPHGRMCGSIQNRRWIQFISYN